MCIPSQIEHTLLSIAGVSPAFQLVVDRKGALDTLHINAERDEVDQVGGDEQLVAEIVHAMRSSLGVGVSVAVVETGSLPRSEGGKLSRTVDNRKV